MRSWRPDFTHEWLEVPPPVDGAAAEQAPALEPPFAELSRPQLASVIPLLRGGRRSHPLISGFNGKEWSDPAVPAGLDRLALNEAAGRPPVSGPFVRFLAPSEFRRGSDQPCPLKPIENVIDGAWRTAPGVRDLLDAGPHDFPVQMNLIEEKLIRTLTL
ncbi:hypothetical protein GCM10009605_32330 [Nocardiopsis composta]